ncbi:MAG: undecaprenyldiphospho-muramoylpentapeptide beta-N-acetylglucosaminyltransferase [Acidobacteriota bacterium]|nr:undecaprenyldiphospho-muramoylpentapeptide beta-N-acetylglucosaminyltransferase [Acidobacteriota bacterium]
MPKTESSSWRTRQPAEDGELRLLIAGGGTGGHLYPGIAVARALARRFPEAEVQFVGSGRPLEARILKEAGYRLNRLPVSGLKGVGRIDLIRGILKLPRSLWAAWGIVRRFRPTVVLGVGGYSSGPPVLVASLAGVPTLLHESNAQPGITNRLLSPFCRKVTVAFPECETFFRGKAVLTGTPVRPEFLARPTRPPERPFVLLIFGGSQGARAINRAMVDALEGLRPHLGQMHFIHQTGEHDFVRVEQAYREAEARALVRPFFTDMPSQFPKAHLVVCRAGAATLGELAAARKASLLVPFPGATDNHQLRNAESLAAAGAAEVIPQDELSGRLLARRVEHYLGHPEELERMEARSGRLARPDSARKIVELIGHLAGSD